MEKNTPMIITNGRVREQITAIMEQGFTVADMFNTPEVEKFAAELGYSDLVDCLENDARGYAKFVLTGKV